MSYHPKVIFGISGSISAYKSLDIIRLLRKSNVIIHPILSTSAHKFVTPWSVESLSETSLLSEDVVSGKITHLEACKNSKLFVVCPASANLIAKLSSGRADDLLTSTFLSFTGKKIIFPAMHTEMYDNPITQANLRRLKESGVIIIEPEDGELACGDTGKGRLPDVNLIADVIQFAFLPTVDLSNKRITITCGGTTEPIDSVRAITNHATGRSGHAMANMAAYLGADVCLIRTNSAPTLDGINTINVKTADEMKAAVLNQAPETDLLLMNAAVSDFQVKNSSASKLKRGESRTLDLVPTEDILEHFNRIKSNNCKSIGFCLHDSNDLINIAKEKRIKKGCDIIIANDATSFGKPIRTVHIIDDKNVNSYENINLYELSYKILDSFNYSKK